MEVTAVPDILFVSPVRPDQVELRRIVGANSTTRAASCRQAIRRLGRESFAIVFCECDLPDGSWVDIRDHIAASGDPPLLIVTSRLADAHLWSRVLNLGGFDVIATPFREVEVRHALASARAHRTGPGRHRHVQAGRTNPAGGLNRGAAAS
jgi:DNA-binding response OmpR family regulator